MICSDRTQCEVCCEMEAFLAVSLILHSSLSCLLHCHPLSERLWAPECVCEAFAFGQPNALQIKTVMEKQPPWHIFFLMTASIFILSVTWWQVQFLPQFPFCPLGNFEISFQWARGAGRVCYLHLKSTTGYLDELHIILKTNENVLIIHQSCWCRCVILMA